MIQKLTSNLVQPEVNKCYIKLSPWSFHVPLCLTPQLTCTCCLFHKYKNELPGRHAQRWSFRVGRHEQEPILGFSEIHKSHHLSASL